MGAWGAGAFENDDALDWILTLEDSSDESRLMAAFDAVLDVQDDLEVPEASAAIAAAEVVAAALGLPGTEPPSEVSAWIAANSKAVGAATARKALLATERVAGESELQELWDESGSREEWRQEIVGLQQRLAQVG